MNYFITGTDTGIGKTYVSCLLIRSLRKAGFDTVGIKPICCGDRDDAKALQAAAADDLDLDDVNPVWFRFPAAPYAASIVENRLPDLDQIRDRYARIRASRRSLIVEGVGGWLVPITRDYFVADLAADLALPVVVVAANRLGMLNHTLLTVQSIQARGLPCAGVILNNLTSDPDPVAATNRSLLEHLLPVPILHEIDFHQTDLPLAVA